MNNRLRKRYLGAGVVVALAAIILPFLLQGEGYKANRQLAESAQSKIPPRPPVVAGLNTNPPTPPEDVRAALIEPESLPKPVSMPAKPQPSAATKPVTDPKVQSLNKPSEKPVEKQPAKPSDAPVAKSAPTQAGAWFIQLGSFTAESNAQNLLKQVQGVGIKAKVERLEVKGSPVWRVTSGSYATRAEADAALNVLKTRLNLGGMVRSAR